MHFIRHDELREHLTSQQVLAARLVAFGAVAVTAVELSVATLTALFAVGVLDRLLLLTCAMAPAVLLFVGFAVYLWMVRRRVGDGGAPCGCGVGESVTTRESIVRAGVLAAVALLAVIGLQGQFTSPDLINEDPLFVVLVASASLTTTVIAMWLPVAFQQNRLLEEALI